MSANPNLWVLLGLGIAGILIMTRKLRRVVREDFGAFVERFELLPPPQPAPPKAPHPLTGLTFAVADVFDIDGYVTGFGNPDWARTHEAAMHTASLVATLIDGGATCVGKTVTDDMAFSLSGENKYLGTPTNPKDPDRVPGGCSSGSAVVVAGGIVDFALGMDTIGGVRVPGAFCGVLAFRPSHDSILKNGVLQVSPSLDVPGLFAKDTSVLRRVAHVLLKLPYADARPPRRVLIADDYFQLMKDSSKRTIEVVTKTVEALYGRQCLSHVNVGEYLASKIPSLKKLQVSNVGSDLKISSLTSLSRAMRVIHKHEFRSNYENWINSAKPTISSCVSNNLSTSADENDISINYCQTARREAQLAVYSLLKDDGILILPTVLGPPPKLNSKEILSEDYQTCLLNLSAISSMSGCCQITIPLRFHEKVPLSVSLIARHGGDRFLLDTVQKMFSVLQEQADLALKPAQSVSASKEESAEIAKEKGNNAYKEKQWQKAISLYTEAIKLNGQNATYYSNRAAAYLEMGSYLQAEGDCNTAINLDKKNVKAFLRRGTAREMLGYYKEAMEDFRYALVLEPTNKTASSAANRLKKFIP